MKGFDGHPGASRLASVLSKRMKRETEAPLVLDFGGIQANGSLLTNTFPKPIPKGEYSVCRQLTLGKTGECFSYTDEILPEHRVVIPEKLRSLRAGDRVLVAWVENEAVVVDIIESS